MTKQRRDDEPEFQAPWEAHGWFADQVEADRSPELARLEADIDGSVLPAARRPGQVINPAVSNPYIAFVLVAAVAGSLGFAFVRVGSLGLTLAVGIPVGAICLAVVAVSVWRIPKWHSARRRARELARNEGVPFPRELRWYA